MTSQQDMEFIMVKTTLPKTPYPPHSMRQPVYTDRLAIRPLEDSDIPALHALRSQKEVMRYTGPGVPDPDTEHTRTVYRNYQPPGDAQTYNFGIFLRQPGTGEEGPLIGAGGSHLRTDHLGWPALGYMLSQESWGKGLATEFVRAFMDMWWGLEREETKVKVEKGMVAPVREGDEVEDGVQAREMMVGITDINNGASMKVMEKCGFVKMREWVDPVPPKYDSWLLGFGCLRPEGE
jgi:RimJ/RimL family protein N-acetyltransferase